MNKPSEQKKHKLLIANRGEIAIRIMQACRKLGLAFVALFTEPEQAQRALRAGPQEKNSSPWPISPGKIERYLHRALGGVAWLAGDAESGAALL